MTLATPNSAPTAAGLDAARLLLARLGISPADLLAAAMDRVPAPTFAKYVPIVRAAVGAGTRRVYGSYWNRIIEHWGTRRLDEPTPSEIEQLAEHLKTNVVERRNSRGGAGLPSTSSLPCAASTTTPKPTATSRPGTTQPTRSPNPDGSPRLAAPSPTPASPKSAKSPRPPATTRPSMHCC
jgi:hypothetical protein